MTGNKVTLLIHRYFWPDTPPYASMLKKIAASLAGDGEEVVVLSTQPSYKVEHSIGVQPGCEKMDGFSVVRLDLKKEDRKSIFSRLFVNLTFCFKIFFQILKIKPKSVMISTFPPVIGALSACLASKIVGGKFIYHCQDIHPEGAFYNGDVKEGFTYKVLRALDSWVCRQAHRIIVLSDDMKNTIVARKTDRQKVIVLNNFALESDEEHMNETNAPIEERFSQLAKHKFNVVFAGNIGRFQNLDEVLDAAEILNSISDVQIVFVGEGDYKERLLDRVFRDGISNVCFIPHQKISVAREIIRYSDLGLVSLSGKVFKCAYPSKTMTYLAEGTPLIVYMDGGSEIHQEVVENAIGISVCSGSGRLLADEILSYVENAQNHIAYRKNAKSYSDRIFGVEFSMKKWKDIFREVSVG